MDEWDKASARQWADWVLGAELESIAEGGARKAPEREQGAIWAERRQELLDPVCALLWQIKEQMGMRMGPKELFKALELDSLIKLMDMGWLDADQRSKLKVYVEALPGFDAEASAQGQPMMAVEIHDHLRFDIELPAREAWGMGFGDDGKIDWARLPATMLEKISGEERRALKELVPSQTERARRRALRV